MTLRSLPACMLLIGSLGLGAAQPAAAAPGEVAVARGQVRLGGGELRAGTVFFLPSRDDVGAVAVGAAHSFETKELVKAGEIEFRRAASGERVSVSNRFYSTPGRAFHAPGATLRDDFVIFALDVRPRGMRVLEPARERLRHGARVRILGMPSDGSADQAQVEGSVSRVTDARIEVDLDEPVDLRGWGGAPVLHAGSGRVVGLLQAAWPNADTLRVGVGPIGGVTEALTRPLDGGRGRQFTAFAAGTHAVTLDAAPPPAPEPRAPKPQRAAEPAARRAPAPSDATLRMEIEQPKPEAVVGNAAGAFMAGRAYALQGEMKRFDIVIVLDTSGSTAAPTGVDVDGNGVVGTHRLGMLGGVLDLGSTDPGDSILAAEVAAAKRLLGGLDPRSTRVGIVTFAGEPVGSRGGGFFNSSRVRDPSITMEPLTSDYKRVADALDRVRARGPRGMTHMAAGVDQATIELLGLQGGLSKSDRDSEKIVLFLTDGAPTLPYEGFESDNVRAVLRAAQRARRAGVRIHSFAIGPDALAGPIATVEMASITDGSFTPVRHPAGIVTMIEAVSFANIEEIRVRNVTSGADAHQVRVHPDGSWDALVPLGTGKNTLEVTARAGNGAEATERVLVHHAPGSADPYLPQELVMKRNELLEARLVELRRGRMEAEARKAEETRRELALEIEEERAAAAERAAEQRKLLELEIDDPSVSEPPQR